MTVHEHTHTHRDGDVAVADEIRRHHAAMVDELATRTQRLEAARPNEADDARAMLTTWLHEVLVPHADEEELTTYRAAAGLTEGRLLIEAMVREHALIKRLVALYEAAEDPAVAAAFARAVFQAFDSHQGKENEVILPLLVESAAVALDEVMGHAHGHHQVGEPHRPGHEHHVH